MAEVGAYSPEVAREVLAVVRQLQASGLLGKTSGEEPLRPIPAPLWVENVSGEEIPAYACMQITGAVERGDRLFLQVDKPQDSIGLAGGFAFNGPASIAADKRAIASVGPQVRAQGDGSTCVCGQGWAPQKGSWVLTQQDGGIFIAIADDRLGSNVVRVATDLASRPLLQFELISSWNLGAADAIISWMDGTETGTQAEVNDPLGIFDELGAGDVGLCEKQGGKLWAVQAPCSGDFATSSGS